MAKGTRTIAAIEGQFGDSPESFQMGLSFWE